MFFDGKTFEGWDGVFGFWLVRDGVIVGLSYNWMMIGNIFFISKESFFDFILCFDIKVINENSGVQFCSEVLVNWVVCGY